MDTLMLRAVVLRLAGELSAQRLLGGERIEHLEYLFRLTPPGSPPLRVSLRPPHPYLHRAAPGERFRSQPPDPFILLVAKELGDAKLVNLDSLGCDRVVQFTWQADGGGRLILVAELIGKSANLILLDSRRDVIGYAREMASAFRSPVVGEAYRPPIPRPGYEDVTWDSSRSGEYLDRFARPGLSRSGAAASFLAGLSRPIGDDFRHRPDAQSDPDAALAGVLSAVCQGKLQPTLYTALPMERMLREPGSTEQPPLLSPFPLHHPPLEVFVTLPDPEEASRMLASLLESQRRFRALRDRIAATLRREEQHLVRLEEKLVSEFEATGRADRYQRYGDLILANLADIEIKDGRATVSDLYGTAGERVEVPADPCLSPAENAERHYGRARKLRRGAETIRRRLESVRSARPRVASWRQQGERALSTDELVELEKELARAGLVAPPRGKRTRDTPSVAPSESGVRKFKTADGFVILVGKSSRDNDRLTFQLATPRDFWFHAADRSGAHVVVRNPSKLKELPSPVRLTAARIAAHFSRARSKGKVEVHYTQKKYVRKGRGFGPGRVVLRNHRTLLVDPGIPKSED